MRLSSRLRSITGGGSDGWDVFYRARRMVAAGLPVTELTIGEHDIRTDPEILSAMERSARAGRTGYALVPGISELRTAVARRVQERTGIATDADNVLITPGGQAALFAAHMACCDEGDHALFIDPFYATYPGTIRATGARAIPVPASAANGFQPDPADIERVAQGARSLLINSPNNPTGVVYSRDTLEGIARIALDHEFTLISDEVYETQVWAGSHVSPRTLPGMADRTLVVGSMSKSHAMTGSRCGWLIGPGETIARLIDLATVTTYGVPAYIQEAALHALSLGQPFEERIAAPFARRRKIVLDVLEGQNVLRAVPADGAMYVMVDIRATGLDGESFANRLLDERRIAVMPGESFGQAAAGHVRIALTIDDDAFRAALTEIVDFAARLAAEPR